MTAARGSLGGDLRLGAETESLLGNIAAEGGESAAAKAEAFHWADLARLDTWEPLAQSALASGLTLAAVLLI